MVEVFKTNVNTEAESRKIISAIRACNPHYFPNFDLQDEDRILRVLSPARVVDVSEIITLVQRHGYCAEVLTDELTPSHKLFIDLH